MEQSGGFGPLIEQARAGAVSLKVDPQAFLALDQAMRKRKSDIEAIQQLTRSVSQHEPWGLGEQSTVLTSARAMVQAFREKAAGGPGSAERTLQSHWQVADELQTLFRTIRERLEQTDSDFAARLRALQPTPPTGGTA
ncbi:hypothetical protein NDR87_15875 [Nocardia sp. CDC159]|uniref:Uncharacterized protein n=1 Tax=Nocardia pulmonis TaxID=2951408 RepID=A0A9X2E9M5_9NOCA|nr:MULTISPECIES: hypothetical protein [Nocardia]MCM6775428.1 hypothetical protein [Nocardia pulmonis]MCM6787838.1 hypothetical protein [Nocardia sp. CDC159]